MSALLRTDGLTAFYGDFQALFGIDFEIHPGEAVGIIGANGAGKSTFLKVVTGLLAAAPVRIVFDGRPIGGLPASEIVRRGIAMVPEGRRLFPSLSVEENLLIGGYAQRKGPWNLARVRAVPGPEDLHAPATRSRAASSRWWPSVERCSPTRAC
jgi:branched-chain amino acid transport system ATP-binding protein